MRSRDASGTEFGASTHEETKPSHALSVVGAAWLLSLGLDVIMHAGILARLYVGSDPFLLQPRLAAQRIPLGYLGVLLLTISLYWIFGRLGIRGAVSGLLYGGSFACVVWAALGLGLYSITTGRLSVLLSWWVAQTIELGAAGAVLGSAAAGASLRRIWAVVVVAAIGCFMATVVMQTLGLAPAVRIAR